MEYLAQLIQDVELLKTLSEETTDTPTQSALLRAIKMIEKEIQQIKILRTF